MEIKLDVDTDGSPIIRIKHMERPQSIEDKLLGVFIESAKNGLEIKNPSGSLEIGGEAWENYIIKTKD